MKRILAILFALCLLLSGCRKEAAAPAGAAGAQITESPASPSPAVQPQRLSPEEWERQRLEEGERWLAENYSFWGCFCARNEDYETFQALPQEDPAVFTVRYFFKMGEAGQQINALENQYMPLFAEEEAIENAAREGLRLPGYTYGADTSAWECNDATVEKSALPLEYFQLADQCQAIGSQITPELQRQRDEERNQFTLALAQLLAEQGLKTEVWAVKTIEYYGETSYYICFLTATPAELWALESLTDISTVSVEPQYESVRLRCDIPIWNSEET